MLLTSILWQARSWNQTSAFMEYAERRGIKDAGHIIHANCFGLPIFGCPVFARWQLACVLRGVMDVMEMCRFLWAAAAIIVIHVTSRVYPYYNMLRCGRMHEVEGIFGKLRF